jgi:hypothetical protein
MSSLRPRSRNWNVAAPATLAAAAFLALAAAMPHGRAQQTPSSSGWRDVNLAEYLQHLQALDGVVADCGKQLSLKTPPPAHDNACDPNRVGPDDRVQWPGAAASEPREVRYDWLRQVLANAGKKHSAAQPSVLGAHSIAKKDQPPVGSYLLSAAHQRLQMDELQAQTPLAANPAYIAQRKSLDAILAQREYKGVTEVSASDRFWEWFDNLLDNIKARLEALGARAPWIGDLLYGLLIAAICTVLVLLFVRLERNSRVRLVPDIEASPGAPSAREWQLWLKDAQAAAAGGQWREAIHSVYWASISRLESRRLWPADRARTPREYLALLRATDPRQPTLTALTLGFERTWYGGREAAASDFTYAMALATELGVEAQ